MKFKGFSGASEMAQLLKELAANPDNLILISRTHMMKMGEIALVVVCMCLCVYLSMCVCRQ